MYLKHEYQVDIKILNYKTRYDTLHADKTVTQALIDRTFRWFLSRETCDVARFDDHAGSFDDHVGGFDDQFRQEASRPDSSAV